MGPEHGAPTCLCTLVFHYFSSHSYASDQPGSSAFPAFTLHAGLAPWTCNLCGHMASALRGPHAWMLCCHSLEILNAWSRGLAFSLCTGSHKLCCWFCLLCIPVFTPLKNLYLPIPTCLVPDSSFKAQLKSHQVFASHLKPEAGSPLGFQSIWLFLLFQYLSHIITVWLSANTAHLTERKRASPGGSGRYILSPLLQLSAWHRANTQYIIDELNFTLLNNPVISCPPGPLLPVGCS